VNVFLAVCSFDAAHWYFQEVMLLGYCPDTASITRFSNEAEDIYHETLPFFTKLVGLILQQADFKLLVEELEEALIYSAGNFITYRQMVRDESIEPNNIAEKLTCLVFNEYQCKIGNAVHVEKVEVLSSAGPTFTMRVTSMSH
jgi:hypothetical protein